METSNTGKEFRIETSFKNELARSQREYLTANITDDEIFALNSEILCAVTAELTKGDYDSKALVKLLSFYLMHSDDCADIKKRVSEEVALFVGMADCVANRQTELRIIHEALDCYEDGQDWAR